MVLVMRQNSLACLATCAYIAVLSLADMQTLKQALRNSARE